MIFLDANASVPPTKAALDRFSECVGQRGNPSAPHGLGRAMRRVLDQARDEVASALGFAAEEVVFTSGASEGNRWIIDAARARGMDRFAMSPLEHPSLYKGLADAQIWPVDARGRPRDLDACQGAQVVFCTAAHNETGIIVDLEEIASNLDDDTIFVVDAAQRFARSALSVARIDALVVSAHKMGGIAGVGAMLLRGRAQALPSPWAGGGQEAGRRPGTEPVALIAAMGAAARDIDTTRQANQALTPLRDALQARVLAMCNGRVVGAGAARLPQTTAIALRGIGGDALRMKMDRQGLAVGFGSACSALAPEPSPGLRALGLCDEEAKATLRLSLAPGVEVDVDEVDRRMRRVFG